MLISRVKRDDDFVKIPNEHVYTIVRNVKVTKGLRFIKNNDYRTIKRRKRLNKSETNDEKA